MPVCTLSWCTLDTILTNDEMVLGSERFIQHYRMISQSFGLKEKQEQEHAFVSTTELVQGAAFATNTTKYVCIAVACNSVVGDFPLLYTISGSSWH